jgi:hypothetical protein
MTLSELREALEKADGPSRELDLAVRELLRSRPCDDFFSAPHYTSSLDAALSLVEHVLPGWDWETGSNVEYTMLSPPVGARRGKAALGSGATPAIGVLSALVRAAQVELEKNL